MIHKLLPPDELHGPFRQIFADEAARLADATTYAVEEVTSGALALQADTMAVYVLTDNSPVTWEPITAVATADPNTPTDDEKDALAGTSGAPSASNKYVTNADPRVPTADENDALAGTNGTPSSVNPYITDSDPRIPSTGENDALAGTDGTPSSSNKYVTNSDARNTNARTPTAHASTHIRGGSDIIDADRAVISWTPTFYTRDNTPTEAGNATDLTAHLAGIDNELGLKLDLAGGTMTGDLDMDGNKIVNLPTPSAASEPATKAYVDSLLYGLDLKASVRALADADVALTGEQTIDDVALEDGDRVMLTGQTDASENGIWVVSTGAWARAADADSDDEVTAGMFAFVAEGTAYESTSWTLITPDPIVLDTTDLEFTQLTGGTSFVAGSALLLTGNVLDVQVDDSTIEVSSNALRIKALGITDAHVAAANKDGASGTPSMRTLGTGAAQAAPGDDSRFTTASSETVAGHAELATQTETNTGTDDLRIVTPLKLASSTTVVHPARTVTAGSGLSGGGDLSADRTFDVNVDDSTIEINSDTLRLKDGGTTAAKLATSVPGELIRAGSREIDGDQLDIDWNPSNYTPTTVSEADNVDELSAHLKGIDDVLGTHTTKLATDDVRWIDFDFGEDISATPQIQRKKAPDGWSTAAVVARCTGIPTAGTIAVERDNDNTTQTQFTGATVNASTISSANTQTTLGTINGTASNLQMTSTSYLKVTVTGLDTPVSTDGLVISVKLVRT